MLYKEIASFKFRSSDTKRLQRSYIRDIKRFKIRRLNEPIGQVSQNITLFLYDSRDRPKMMPRGQNSEVQNIHDRKSLPFVAANKHGLSAFLN